MTNLEAAQELCDEARKLLANYQAPEKVRMVVEVLDIIIQENREMRTRLSAVSDSMNYSLPGGQRA